MIIRDIKSIYTYKTDRESWECKSSRTHHIISYQSEGSYSHTFPFGVLEVSKGKLFFINKNDPYSVKCNERGHAICALIDGDIEMHSGIWDAEGDPEVYRLFAKLLNIKNLSKTSNKYSALSIAYELFSFIERQKEPSSISHDHLERIELSSDYISEHIQDGPISTRELADFFGISERHYRTLFKRKYGKTPSEYITEVRMNMASRLLSTAGFTVTEAAYAVGIFDVYYFSKLFKAKFGVPPSRHAKGIE